VEFAGQAFLTSKNSSFAKVDLRHQWNWPVGFHAENGVFMVSARLGLARPTASSSQALPLSERFFGGGSATVRGVEPDMLGPLDQVASRDAKGNKLVDANGNLVTRTIPLGGQALAVLNLEYRFPFFGMSSLWAEVFVDAGQVYRSLLTETTTNTDPSTNIQTTVRVIPSFPALRVTPGIGLILKLGFPLKVEYAVDWKRLTRRPRTAEEQQTQLKSLLISAGYQF
jgi:outer membrane protein assembly factor BamA